MEEPAVGLLQQSDIKLINPLRLTEICQSRLKESLIVVVGGKRSVHTQNNLKYKPSEPPQPQMIQWRRPGVQIHHVSVQFPMTGEEINKTQSYTSLTFNVRDWAPAGLNAAK